MKNKIGIIGAMQLEVDLLLSIMKTDKVTQKASLEFHEGIINDTAVVIVRSGIGKVNAALCTQILVDLFTVTHIINTGIAGSLDNDLDIGDIVISKDALHHDLDIAVFGYALGQVPGLDFVAFKADETLINLATTCFEKYITDSHMKVGRIVSGDQFINSSQVKEQLIANFEGTCAEMEGAAIAHVAYMNQIPFVIIRALSDKADQSANMVYEEFEAKAANHCATLVAQIISNFQ